jgi:hypothetical protein
MMLTSLARLRRHGALLVIAALLMLHARIAFAGCLVPDLASLAAERAAASVASPCHETTPEASGVCLTHCVHSAADLADRSDPGVLFTLPPVAVGPSYPLACLGEVPWVAAEAANRAADPPLIYLLQRLLT